MVPSSRQPDLNPEYKRARSDDEKQEREAAIVLAARHEFDERGMHAFTMTGVAKRVHISKAALYGYHESKWSILATLTVGMVRSWAAELRQRNGSTLDASGLRDSLDGRGALLDLSALYPRVIAPELEGEARVAVEAQLAHAHEEAGVALGADSQDAAGAEHLSRAVLALLGTGSTQDNAVNAILGAMRASGE